MGWDLESSELYPHPRNNPFSDVRLESVPYTRRRDSLMEFCLEVSKHTAQLRQVRALDANVSLEGG